MQNPIAEVILWTPNGIWEKFWNIWSPIKKKYVLVKYSNLAYAYVLANHVTFIKIDKVKEKDITDRYNITGSLKSLAVMRMYIERMYADKAETTQKEFLLTCISLMRGDVSKVKGT